MANIKYGNTGFGVNMSKTTVEGLLDYDFMSRSSSSLKLYDDSGNFVTFSGSGISYQMQGGKVTGIKGGTMTGMKLVVDGTNVLSISDAKVSAAKLGAAVFGGDDAAFVALVLGGHDKITGTNYDDVIIGLDGNDRLHGRDGDDVLKGGAGADKIGGGKGADDLYGGSGADIFVFTKLSDSTTSSSGRDTIFDFSGKSGDRIDLSTIDAVTKTSADEEFTFIGTKAFSGKAGELRYEKKASDTYIYANVNGDKKADFAIHLDDRVTLHEDYFIL